MFQIFFLYFSVTLLLLELIFFFLKKKQVWNASSSAYVRSNQRSVLLLGLNKSAFWISFCTIIFQIFFSQCLISEPEWRHVLEVTKGYVWFDFFGKDIILCIYNHCSKTIKYCLHVAQVRMAATCIQASYKAGKKWFHASSPEF